MIEVWREPTGRELHETMRASVAVLAGIDKDSDVVAALRQIIRERIAERDGGEGDHVVVPMLKWEWLEDAERLAYAKCTEALAEGWRLSFRNVDGEFVYGVYSAWSGSLRWEELYQWEREEWGEVVMEMLR